MNNNKENIMDKNVVIMDAEILRSVQYDLSDLVELLESVISDLHNAQGGQQLRHSYILYRDRVENIKDKLKNARTNEQQ